MEGYDGFDHHELLARLGGDHELLREVIAIFLAQTPQQLSALRAAADAGDGDAVHRAAHAFKGSIAVFAARAALAAVSDAELAGVAGDLAAAKRAIASLERAVGRLCAGLREMAA